MYSYKAIEPQSDEDYEKIREKIYSNIPCINFCPFLNALYPLLPYKYYSYTCEYNNCELKEMFGRYSP